MRSCLQMFGDLAKVLVAVPKLEFLPPDRIFMWCSLVWQIEWGWGVIEPWVDFWLCPLVAMRPWVNYWISLSLSFFYFLFLRKVTSGGASEIISVKHLSHKKIRETLKIRNVSLYSVLGFSLGLLPTCLTMVTSGQEWEAKLEHIGV